MRIICLLLKRKQHKECPQSIPDVSLPDEHTGMVDGLSHTGLEDEGLEAALEKVLDSKRQHVIELVLALIQQAIPVHPPQQGLALENPTWILLIQRQKHSGIVSDPAQSILNPPQLPFAPQPILSHELQFRV